MCVFYLVLRALDTVEDDMAIPVEEKVPILRAFHEKIFQRLAESCLWLALPDRWSVAVMRVLDICSAQLAGVGQRSAVRRSMPN